MNFKDAYKSMNDNIHGDRALMHMIMNGEAPKKKKSFFLKFKPVCSVALAAVFALCAVTLYRNTGFEEYSATNDKYESEITNTQKSHDNDNVSKKGDGGSSSERSSEDNAHETEYMSEDAHFEIASNPESESQARAAYEASDSVNFANGQSSANHEASSDDTVALSQKPSLSSSTASEDASPVVDNTEEVSHSGSSGGSASRVGTATPSPSKSRAANEDSAKKSQSFAFRATCSNILSVALLPSDLKPVSQVVYPADDPSFPGCVGVTYEGNEGRMINIIFCANEISFANGVRVTQYDGITVMVTTSGLSEEEIETLMSSVTKY